MRSFCGLSNRQTHKPIDTIMVIPFSRYVPYVLLVSASVGLVGFGGWHLLSRAQPPVPTTTVAEIVRDSNEPNQASSGSQISRNIPNRKVRVILPGPVAIRSPPGGIAGAQGEAMSGGVFSGEDPSGSVQALSSATLPATAPRQAETVKNCDIACGKYRSLRASDCTYQPYRGPRKVCETAQARMQPRELEAFAFVPPKRSNCNVQWCSRQYRSFDDASCTYQPFGGGPRKRCEPDGR
jgi:hypothetical protein